MKRYSILVQATDGRYVNFDIVARDAASAARKAVRDCKKFYGFEGRATVRS